MITTRVNRALFVIQRFDSKCLEDSAGMVEIVNPLIQSGLVKNHEVFSWGKDYSFWHNYIAQQVADLAIEVKQQAVTIYGAGEHSLEYWRHLAQFNVRAIADKQSDKWNIQLNQCPIISPDAIETEHVIVSSRAWEATIIEELKLKYPDKKIYGLYSNSHEMTQQFNRDAINRLHSLYDLSAFDLLIYTPAEPRESLSADQLKSLKTASNGKLAVVWWDYDDSSENNVYCDFERDCLSQADLIIDPGNYTRVNKLKQHQFPYQNFRYTDKVHLLPTPVDSSAFYPRSLKTVELAIFGSDVGLRGRWISLLSERFSCFQHIGGVSNATRPIPLNEYARLSGASKIIVNTQTYEFRSQCKGKVREALASGALLIEQDCYDSRMFFQNCDFVRFFSTEEELLEVVSYYLEHENERAVLAEAGLQWYTQNWSPTPWSTKLIESLNLD